MKRRWLLSMLIPPSISGCGCELILYTYPEPRTLNLTVGKSAPLPKASQSGCGEPRHSIEIGSWKSENPAVASVDADSGVVGETPGTTEIAAYTLERNVDGDKTT